MNAIIAIPPNIGRKAVLDVLQERNRQDRMWGEQNHDPFTYLTILLEEVGEFSEEALTLRFHPTNGSLEDLRTEAVQVAAVALAIVECLDRERWSFPTAGLPESVQEALNSGDGTYQP